MEYAGSIDSGNGYQKKGVTVIEWTQEKEDFLAGVVSKIEELGWLLTDFFGDAEANIAHSLTAGGNRILLAPPKETGDQHGNS
jgi:hypothetical protein